MIAYVEGNYSQDQVVFYFTNVNKTPSPTVLRDVMYEVDD